MSQAWDCLLDGNSIRNKIAQFDIFKGGGSFCKELTLGLNDSSLYASFNFQQVPAAPRLEIRTEVDGIWASEGIFFIEKPTLVQTKDAITLPALRGRDESARLTQPFAARISKEWPTDTTLFTIIQELLESCGLEYSASRILISDYLIYAGSYSVQGRYPLEILQELVGKTDGYLATDRNNLLWVLRDLYHCIVAPGPGDTLHGAQIQQITEIVELPDFGNRIKVGTYSRTDEANLAIALELDDSSIAIGETTRARAVVTHLDGSPVADGHVVDWTTDNPAYAHWLNARTTVYTRPIPAEAQYATSRYLVSTTYPIRQIHSVIEVATGLVKTVKEFKGRSITLDEATPLTFIDSAVLIDYETAWAENTLVAGVVGEVQVDCHAIVAVYIRDTRTVRIDTESGASSEDKDKLVTIEIIDFHTELPIPGAAFFLDGVAKGVMGSDGQLDIGLVAGGEHGVIITADDHKPSNLPDGLANDTILVT
jgi:hypothetical protein